MGPHHIKIKNKLSFIFKNTFKKKWFTYVLMHYTYFHKAGQKLLGHTWEIGPKTQFVLHTVCIATYN